MTTALIPVNKRQTIFAILYALSGIFIVSFLCDYTLKNVRTPDGDIIYYLIMPIAILIYLTYTNLFRLLFNDESNESIKFIMFFIFCLEIALILPLYAFNLISHLLLFLIIVLKALNLISYLIDIYKYNHKNPVYLNPNYDLILYALLSFFIAYIPFLHQRYISIQEIKIICNMILIFAIIILSYECLKHFNLYQKLKFIRQSKSIL